MMHYYSTNRNSPPVNLEQATLRGLAPDGGLYVPERIPHFTAEELGQLERLRAELEAQREPDGAHRFLQEVGARVLQKWFGEEIEAEVLRAISLSAQSFPIPVREVGPLRLLELFHGPTMAFKDVAARNLARLMGYFLKKREQQAILLVATSGDTGGAIAHGFAGQENIRVVVLFPRGKISKLQEEQLTRVAENVTPVEVDGVFDDCQGMVKQAFNHPGVRHLNLTSANSINVARLIPQSIYYVYLSLLLGDPHLEVVVPSGNFGNLAAALYAREMGLALDSFIAATNRNDAAVRYYRSGDYEPRPTVTTLSTAMDVGNPSNFARILELFGYDHARFTTHLRAFSIDDGETEGTIRRVYEQYGYLLCPHSAVGWAVAESQGRADRRQVVVATASPVKFASEIRSAVGIEVDDSAEIERLRVRPSRKVSIDNRWEELEALLLQLAG